MSEQRGMSEENLPKLTKAPTLQYLAVTRGGGALQVVGPIFQPQKYAIAMAIGNPLGVQFLTQGANKS